MTACHLLLFHHCAGAIIAAIEAAVADGMDIINLSLSLGPGFPSVSVEVWKKINKEGLGFVECKQG
jgi:ABC-type uncharacterized transport system YnjBCD permease subunit